MKSILVIKPSSLGDIIHGLQVIQSLREQVEDVRVTWVVRECFASFVEACDTVDEVLIFERKGGVSAFFKLIKKIRKHHFDFVLDFQGLARSGLLTLLSKGTQKVVRSDAREGARFMGGAKAPLPKIPNKAHAIEILLEFLPILGLKAELKGHLSFSVLKNEVDKFDNIKDPILIFPDSRRPEKEWPYFYELTDKLINKFPDKQFIWMGQKEMSINTNWSKSSFLNLIKKTSLLEVIPLIAQASLVICNDSGPMHLAAAIGRPLVALFGPTEALKYGPYPLDKENHYVMEAPKKDLSLLSAEEVSEKIQAILV